MERIGTYCGKLRQTVRNMMHGGNIMKKLFTLLLAAAIMLAGAGGYCSAGAETVVSVWLDGEKITLSL